MDKRKNKTVMKVAIVLLIGMNIFLIFQSKDHKKFINNYIKLYYNQVLIKEDEKNELLKDYESSRENAFYRKYDEYLTYNFMEKFIENGKLPNFNLIEYGIKNNIESYKIVNSRIRSKGKDRFDVKYDLLLINKDGKKENAHHEEIYSLKRDGKNYKIDSIDVKVKNLN